MLYFQGQENPREEVVGEIKDRRQKHIKPIVEYNHLKLYGNFDKPLYVFPRPPYFAI